MQRHFRPYHRTALDLNPNQIIMLHCIVLLYFISTFFCRWKCFFKKLSALNPLQLLLIIGGGWSNLVLRRCNVKRIWSGEWIVIIRRTGALPIAQHTFCSGAMYYRMHCFIYCTTDCNLLFLLWCNALRMHCFTYCITRCILHFLYQFLWFF